MRDAVSRPRSSRAAAWPALAAGGLAAAAIAMVWALEARGYDPCELCLKERLPYYAAVPLAALVALGAGRLRASTLRAGYAALALLFAAAAVLGAYHAGVEWQWWAGPSACSGAVPAPAAVGDFLKQLRTAKVVRCDEAALRVLGLSLAGWNAVLAAGLCGLCGFGASRA